MWNFKNHPYKSIILSICVFLLVLALIGYFLILANHAQGYNTLAFLILILWCMVFLGYFVWATYFYNFNYGVSKGVWKKIEESKSNKASGKVYDQDILDDEPLYNPYKDQTFGLPPGTVRGMIAFTLLFGAIALLLVSFGMEEDIEPGSFIRDQFEFFKTAFLMMVAFYFGSRSLKYLKKNEGNAPLYNTANSQRKGINVAGGNENGNNATPEVPSPPSTPNIVVINNDDNNATVPGQPAPITAIDPMAQ